MGVLMPSVDRVGREFPLTLVSSIVPSLGLSQTHMAATSIFEQLELIALDALEDGVTPEILGARLKNVQPNEDNPNSPSQPQTALIQESIWSARLGDSILNMRCSGLPSSDEMEGLFDVNARIWKTNNQLLGVQT